MRRINGQWDVATQVGGSGKVLHVAGRQDLLGTSEATGSGKMPQQQGFPSSTQRWRAPVLSTRGK